MKIIYSPRCLEYAQPGHPESPSRVRYTYEFLEERGFTFLEPQPCSEQDILLAHSGEMFESVKQGTFFDFDTPVLPGIYELARLSAGAAVHAARHCAETGEPTFSLMRPPGHHATRDRVMGFCYFNNIAIACLRLQRDYKNIQRIGIVDFDCHHGNGTEDIVLGHKDVLYLSLHQSPLFPGTGRSSRDNCINYPLPAGTSPAEYLAVFEEGLGRMRTFNPDIIAVSAGFDSYRKDPITSFLLDLDTYSAIGRMLVQLGKPCFAVLEGGYSRDLPECVYQFLSALSV